VNAVPTFAPSEPVLSPRDGSIAYASRLDLMDGAYPDCWDRIERAFAPT